MAEPIQRPDQEEWKMDTANLYREETYTDLRSGSLLRLTPVTPDGSDDVSRPPIFVARTQLATNVGALPVETQVDAANLSEAIDHFPAAIQKAIEDLARRVEEHQREQSRRIVTPDQLASGPQRSGGGLII